MSFEHDRVGAGRGVERYLLAHAGSGGFDLLVVLPAITKAVLAIVKSLRLRPDLASPISTFGITNSRKYLGE